MSLKRIPTAVQCGLADLKEEHMVISGAPSWVTAGWIIALLVLILCVVFVAIGRLDVVLGGLIAGVALARLL